MGMRLTAPVLSQPLGEANIDRAENFPAQRFTVGEGCLQGAGQHKLTLVQCLSHSVVPIQSKLSKDGYINKPIFFQIESLIHKDQSI